MKLGGQNTTTAHTWRRFKHSSQMSSTWSEDGAVIKNTRHHSSSRRKKEAEEAMKKKQEAEEQARKAEAVAVEKRQEQKELEDKNTTLRKEWYTMWKQNLELSGQRNNLTVTVWDQKGRT